MFRWQQRWRKNLYTFEEGIMKTTLDNFCEKLSIDKKAIKILGIDAAVLFFFLKEKWESCYRKEWFHTTQIERYENTGLSLYRQRKAIEKLIEMKIILMENKEGGVKHSRQYFKLLPKSKELENG
jgi:hypothetical protein